MDACVISEGAVGSRSVVLTWCEPCLSRRIAGVATLGDDAMEHHHAEGRVLPIALILSIFHDVPRVVHRSTFANVKSLSHTNSHP